MYGQRVTKHMCVCVCVFSLELSEIFTRDTRILNNLSDLLYYLNIDFD